MSDLAKDLDFLLNLVSIKPTEVQTWQLTLMLRMYRPTGELQQAWQCIETGDIKWEAIPAVNE